MNNSEFPQQRETSVNDKETFGGTDLPMFARILPVPSISDQRTAENGLQGKPQQRKRSAP